MASFLSGLLGLDAGKATQAAAQQNKKLYDQLGTQGQGYINTGEQQSGRRHLDCRRRGEYLIMT
jgi:hypothetical protein